MRCREGLNLIGLECPGDINCNDGMAINPPQKRLMQPMGAHINDARTWRNALLGSDESLLESSKMIPDVPVRRAAMSGKKGNEVLKRNGTSVQSFHPPTQCTRPTTVMGFLGLSIFFGMFHL